MKDLVTIRGNIDVKFFCQRGVSLTRTSKFEEPSVVSSACCDEEKLIRRSNIEMNQVGDTQGNFPLMYDMCFSLVMQKLTVGRN